MTICYEPDGVTPCRFEEVCHEGRKRLQAGQRWSCGTWREVEEPLRGLDCWAYGQMLREAAYPVESGEEPSHP